jgi:hypothetical protein
VLRLRFQANVVYWRGPAPWFFAPIPPEHVEDVRRASKVASYGWGVIPVEAEIAGVVFTTSLFPKDGTYLLPIKANVRKKLNVTAGDTIDVAMTIEALRR